MSTTITPTPTERPASSPTPAGRPISTDRRTAALIAGGGYVALFVLAVIANFVVLERTVVAGDAGATLANIVAAPGRFRLGIAAFLVIAVVDVVVAWALHRYLREVHEDRSLLAAWLRVLHSVFLGVGLAFLSQADHLARSAGGLTPDATASTAAQVALALDTFDTMWMVGLAFFGLHLLVLATLLIGPEAAAPRLLRAVLAFAGVAYVLDTFVHTVVSDYDAVAATMLAIVALPSVVGEGWFGLWLLTRAGRGSRSTYPRTSRRAG